MRFRAPDEKPVVWIGSSYRDLVAMPANIQKQIGRALYIAQHGDRADFSKPMHGRDLANVMEIVVDDLNRTIRGAYTTACKDVVYVLDIFVKKSKSGSATPKRDEDRIRRRYRAAKEHYEAQKRDAF